MSGKGSDLWAAALAVLIFSAPLPVQNIAVDWFTIDGGGGTSTGGVYSVSGTIGQPDAGVAMVFTGARHVRH